MLGDEHALRAEGRIDDGLVRVELTLGAPVRKDQLEFVFEAIDGKRSELKFPCVADAGEGSGRLAFPQFGQQANCSQVSTLIGKAEARHEVCPFFRAGGECPALHDEGDGNQRSSSSQLYEGADNASS